MSTSDAFVYAAVSAVAVGTFLMFMLRSAAG